MTQMMLFNANSLAPNSLATVNSSVTAPSPVGNAPFSPNPVASNPGRGKRIAANSATSPSFPTPVAGEDGVHRMGDLARLVLLRYQLVARRREEMAARRAK